MEIRWSLLVLWAAISWISDADSADVLPAFTQDMNNLPLSESTPVGSVVYTLQGTNPSGGPVKYSLVGTDKFSVDPVSGEVTLVQPLDREKNDTLKFLVSIKNEHNEGQTESVTVIVWDENDNPPEFKNSPYEVYVPEDEVVGKTVLQNILVEDRDTVGDNLEVGCLPNEQWPEACDIFEVVALQSSANSYSGVLVLKKPLDYNEKQFYQFQLYASDGALNSTAPVEVKVEDVQNSPPVFSGALSGSLAEDAPVGTLALVVRARDADRVQPREVFLELLTNPLDYFLLDSASGNLVTAKPLDREALADPSSPLNLTIRATEIVNGSPLVSPLTSSIATATITIRDVNDEPPRFSKPEYRVEVPESLPVGTPLPNLDMVVTDRDVGLNSVFTLRLSDEMGAYIVEPANATGSASVTLRLNSSLDYEDPNQRKFILEVIAEESHTSPRLSSKASVIVTVTDVNDNAPTFADEAYSASVLENAPGGALVAIVKATDRDTGRFGTDGIIYQLSGNGAELFMVNNRSGAITVAPCISPGTPPCLDYETRRDYFLQYKAIDDDGAGQTTVVPLQISLLDSNDNPPVFTTSIYKASIDEDAIKFEPDLQVQARDVDTSSEIRYYIIEPSVHPFSIDDVSGKISPKAGGVATNDSKIVLTVLATDGVHNATCKVEINIRDVNNHAPEFDQDKYEADISEDAPPGTEVAAVRATDLDSGANAELKYAIQHGALDAFAIDNVTGVVTVSSKLDYDKRNTYRIAIVAADLGMPSHTGTTELTVHVSNVNDKKPYFTPTIQRAEVSADAELGTVIHNLMAMDPDITDSEQLVYELPRNKMIKAVDKNGQEVSDEGIFDSWFSILSNGSVVVSQRLDRSRAAVLSLPVTVIDASANPLQEADGELIITIVDVNRHAPTFSQPAYEEYLVEEQPIGTVLNKYTATDKETPISALVIYPPSPYFQIDNVTGVVKSTQRIDYETVRSINFTLVAYDSGVPQRSSTAQVIVHVENANDEEPVFAAPQYDASLQEHAPAHTSVVTVSAVDKDEGEFGQVRYSLTGELSNLFSIDELSGVVTVAEGADIDREVTSDIWLRAVASDGAPPAKQKTTSVPLHIKVLDINDHAPVFAQSVYKSTISENLQLNPPAAILQVSAEDKDEGLNGKVEYAITEQSVPGTFSVDPITGIIYPARPVVGNATYHLTVSGTDRAGAGLAASARVDITVLSVNKHSPEFVLPPPEQRQLEIPENAAQADYLITTIQATDEDSGDNGRVSYYLKVDNQRVSETPEFSLDRDTGELRTKTFLDREHQSEYMLVIAAVDNGTPAQFESLMILTVVLADDDDNTPRFSSPSYLFTVKENLPTGVIVGTVKAVDNDSGENGKVYYHILEGNENGDFTLDRTKGVIRANISFDREKQPEYSLTIYASNNPILEQSPADFNSVDNSTEGQESSVASVKIKVLDENDNEPKFPEKTFYAAIKHTARVNEAILSVAAEDPDLEENGTLVYMVAASNLYKFGASKSSGSVVPSPFNITQEGVLMTAGYMAEYNQDRFVLDIIARELAPPHREAKAQVYIWITDRSSLIRMVVSRGCARPEAGVRRRLAAASAALLVPARRLHLVHADRLYDDWCEIHLLPVDPASYQILPVERVLETVDSKYDELKDVYQEYGVETLTAASATAKAPDSFDPALAALIALLIVLFTGIVTFIVVCACLKHWVIPPPSLQSSKGDSLARRRILEELSTTENPLWLETKLRPYEEQELTMNVFGDQAEQGNVEPPQTDNTYATIQGSRATERFGDYATLGGDSPTPLEAALGFQGSTFKPPSPATPEPPPRPSAGLGPL
ncbi:cadherin-87A isoform X2 [Cydia pomonella]|uniref:cadherin-87A isoform X2 n=1 Tax=Cydia pomonella TaxID=82600 RepID=UPI002ADDD329|nr:cadherin-87A isoform X2 [Cydia pomonella]